MHKSLVTIWPLFILGVAHAQTSTNTLDPVVVTGSRAEVRAFDAPYAISVVDADDLRAGGLMVNLSEALSRVPGLTVNNRGNYAQDLQISSRGFGARASFGVRGLRLYTDGIPATMPDGSGQVSHFDLASAQRVEVLRGPFSALYGNASGGVIALYSAATKKQLQWSADYGSHGTRQLRAQLGLPLDNGFDVQATASSFRTDGFRPHGEAERNLGQVRLGWQGGRDKVVVIGNALYQPAQDPLGLTRAQFNADSKQTASQATDFDTRKTSRQQQLGANWTRTYDGSLRETAVTAYLGHRTVTQWQAIPAAAQASPASAGGVIDFDRMYGGLDARATWRLGERSRLVAGVLHERQSDDRRGFENFVGTQLGVTGALRRDETNKADTTDVYAQGEFDLTSQLVATAGLRHGRVRFESDDTYLSNGDDSGSQTFTSNSPVIGLQWRATPTLNAYVSAGRGFESPTLNEVAYRSDGLSGFNAGLQASTSKQLEAGVKWRSDDSRASADLAVFRADTEDEIATRTNVGGRSSFANVGRTRRQGVEVSGQWKVVPTLRSAVAFTWLDAKYRDGFLTCTGTPCATPTTPVPAGNRIAGTSPRSVFAEVAWRPVEGREAAIEWRGQGRVAVNDVNSDFAAGYGVFALRGEYLLSAKAETLGAISLFARIDNLFDKKHAGSVIVNEGNGRFFEPGALLSGFVGVRVKL
jgi:iron complex outermembrane receptor protein